VDHRNVVAAKSLPDGEGTSSRESAQGVCLGDYRSPGGKVGGEGIGESAPAVGGFRSTLGISQVIHADNQHPSSHTIQ